MEKQLVLESISSLKNNYLSTAGALMDYLKILFKSYKVEERESSFGIVGVLLGNQVERVCIDIYATGMVVMCCQVCLTDTEKTSLDTSLDFLPPDMMPNFENCYNLNQSGVLDDLVKAIKIHFIT